MDTNKIILQSWQHTFRTLLGREEDESVLVATFGEPLIDTMQNFFQVGKEKAAEYVDIYRSYQQDIFLDSISLFPGVAEMLEDLKAAGYRLALVTSRLKPTTLMAIEKFDLAKYFDVVITANDCTKHKPDPQPISMTLEKLGISAEEAVMVGDTLLDLGCAANAGVTSVLVGWSMALAEPEKRKNAAADYIINDAAELLRIVSEL